MVDVLFGAGVGKALEFIIATSVSHVSGETWRGSVPLPRVPRCPRGRDRTRARRGSGCGKGEGPTGAWPAARLPTNRNPPDLKLGQKHDLKRTAGLEVLGLRLFLWPLAAGDRACLTGQKFGIKTASRWISAASGSMLCEQKCLQESCCLQLAFSF